MVAVMWRPTITSLSPALPVPEDLSSTPTTAVFGWSVANKRCFRPKNW